MRPSVRSGIHRKRHQYRPDSQAAAQSALPVLNEVFNETRADLGILGLVIALWAGSRAVMSYVQSIMLINGEYVEAQLPPTPWAFVGPLCRGGCVVGFTVADPAYRTKEAR